MGACNCMSKKTDNSNEILNEPGKDKQDAPPAEPPGEPEVVVSNVLPVPELAPVKEVQEETAQDPNLLLSQVQACFKGFLARKALEEFGKLPPPVFKIDFLTLNRDIVVSSELRTKVLANDPFKFKDPAGFEYRILHKLQDGTWFQGEMQLGKPHGSGSMITPDGNFYEGSLIQGEWNGFGRWFSKFGDLYLGEFKDGKRNGNGKIEFVGGNVYEGEWKNDMCHGKGKEVHVDGFQHEGLFEDGLKHGPGKSIWPDGSSYEGDFQKDMYEGRGRYIWPDKEYDGEWKNSKMHGKGMFKFSDGRSYEGDYLDGNKHGFGVFRWSDEKRYEGSWVNGKQDGQGVMYNKGKKLPGIWKEGTFVEKLKTEKS